ncbi:MAG: (d)CMP kinase [Moraxellaceae bacterium]|nr:(d)CMP kinase [Moraxellaceae bacterium]MCP5176513.1 (d)CMP kinase [Moraxellaceae bacterium]
MSADLEPSVKPIVTIPPVITIDGPSGSGKGTIAHRLAVKLGFHVLDSGALYRLLALAAQQHGVQNNNEAALQVLAAHLDAQFQDNQGEAMLVLEGEDVTHSIRTEEIGAAASKVAALPSVREALLQRQHAFRETPGLVADGRDMGTVVFPDASLKIFLTASAEARAERRYKQLIGKGFAADLAAIVEDIKARDLRDSQRAVSPLKPADDAIVLDSTALGIEAVLSKVWEAAQNTPNLQQFLTKQ